VGTVPKKSSEKSRINKGFLPKFSNLAQKCIILNPKFEILNPKQNFKYQKQRPKIKNQKLKTKIKDEKIKLEFLNCSVVCL